MIITEKVTMRDRLYGIRCRLGLGMLLMCLLSCYSDVDIQGGYQLTEASYLEGSQQQPFYDCLLFNKIIFNRLGVAIMPGFDSLANICSYEVIGKSKVRVSDCRYDFTEGDFTFEFEDEVFWLRSDKLKFKGRAVTFDDNGHIHFNIYSTIWDSSFVRSDSCLGLEAVVQNF